MEISSLCLCLQSLERNGESALLEVLFRFYLYIILVSIVSEEIIVGKYSILPRQTLNDIHLT